MRRFGGGLNMSVDLKTLTPDTTINDSAVLFGADSQASSTPSVYAVSTLRTHILSTANTFTQPQIVSVNSSSDALRITQTGAGNALVVEDEANPDASPFVVTANGSVGIGTSSPSGKLDVRGGTLEFDPGGGADATRAFNFNIGGSNFGKILIPSGSGGAMAFWTGSAGAALERMRITNGGNVGIANTSPSVTLHVGDPAVTTDRTVRVTNSNMPTGFDMLVSSGGPGGYLWVRDNSFMSLGTNNLERLRITSAGDVGIGVSSIQTDAGSLQLFGRDRTGVSDLGVFAYNVAEKFQWAIGPGTQSNNNGVAKMWRMLVDKPADPTIGSSFSLQAYTGFDNSRPGNYVPTTGWADRLTVTGVGNVGIGTSSPGNALTISRTGGTAAYLSSLSGANQALYGVGGGGELVSGMFSSQPYLFYTNSIERVRITSTGNVGINASNPARLLEVRASGTDIPARLGNSQGNMDIGGSDGTTVNIDTRNWVMSLQTNSLERMRITPTTGNVCIGTTAAGTSAEKVLAIGTGVAPTTGPADTIQIYSTDLSAGNTILSLFTEGTPVNANTTAAATHRIAVRINGTVYYLLANTAA